jgi:hypothetical protein
VIERNTLLTPIRADLLLGMNEKHQGQLSVQASVFLPPAEKSKLQFTVSPVIWQEPLELLGDSLQRSRRQ